MNKPNKYRIGTRHPDWVGDLPDFDANYQIVRSESFPLAGPSPGTKRFGPKTPRVCAFCNRPEPSARFQSDAHAFPAGLGNRDMLSNEECDDCNQAFSASDNELVKMLEPHRMVARGQRRRARSAPKVMGDGGESYITWSPETGGISVVVKDHATSTMVKVDDVKKEINLTITRPPFRPLEALRSLLRSAWMISDAAFRLRHPEMLRMITAGIRPPARYIDLSVAGNQLRVGRMVVYEKSGAVDGADVIVAFTFGNVTLLFSLPNEAGEYPPSLLPAIEVFATTDDIGRGRLHLLENDSVRPAAPFSFSLKFQNRVEGDGELEPEADAPNATLEVERNGERVSVRTRAKIIQRSSQTKISLRGGEFAAKLTLTIRNRDPGEIVGDTTTEQVNFMTEFSTVSIDVARRTIRLFELLSVEGAICRFALDGAPPMTTAISKAPSFDFEDVSKLLDYLSIINAEFKTDLRMPAEFDDKYVDAARLLADAIRMGRVPLAEGVFSFTITDMKTAAKVLPELEKETLSMELGMQLRLCEPPLDPGPVTMEMIRPRIVERVTLGSGPDEQVRVGISADETAYVFERFKDRAVPYGR